MRRLAPRRPALAAAGVTLFAATAVLVAAGSLTGADRYAVWHLMPWLGRAHHLSPLSALALPQLRGSFAHSLLSLCTYPAAVLPSLLLVLLAAARLPAGHAVTWLGIWVAGNAVEVAGKALVERPVIFTPFYDTPFGHSLPSGHTIRALVVAAALASAWRAGVLAFAWSAGVVVALVLLGDHTPSDVAAGVFVALALAGWVPPAAYATGSSTRPAIRSASAGSRP
ncbi:MAG TPA: phosphatase PAP2 family protein [Gaiellaceae bacterium]